MATTVVKILYAGSLRRVTVTEEVTFPEFKKIIGELFDLSDNEKLTITYRDIDYDVVTMGSDKDLWDAVVSQRLNPLRVFVERVQSITKPESATTGVSAASAPAATPAAGAEPEAPGNKLSSTTPAADTASEDIKGLAQLLGLQQKLVDPLGRSTALLAALEKATEPLRSEVPLVLKQLLNAAGLNAVKTPLAAPAAVAKEAGPSAPPPAPESKPDLGNKAENKSEKMVSDAHKRAFEKLKAAFEGRPCGNNSDAFMGSLHEHAEKMAEIIDGLQKSGISAAFEPTFDPPPIRGEGSKARSACCSSAKTSGKSAEEDVHLCIHQGIQCDVCDVVPIVGIRYKSTVKKDFDLCSRCFAADANKGDYCRIDRPEFPAWRSHQWNAGGGLQFGGFPFDRQPRGFGPCLKGRPPVNVGRGGGPCNRFSDSSESKLDARFVKDVTIFDGTELAPRTLFTKIWRLRNSGSATWPANTKMVCVGGDNMLTDGGIATLELSDNGVAPEEEIEVSVSLIAPEKPGRYVSHWRLMTPMGRKFGHRVWALVQVVPTGAPSPQVAESVADSVRKAHEGSYKTSDASSSSSGNSSSLNLDGGGSSELSPAEPMSAEAFSSPVVLTPPVDVPAVAAVVVSAAPASNESPVSADHPAVLPKDCAEPTVNMRDGVVEADKVPMEEAAALQAEPVGLPLPPAGEVTPVAHTAVMPESGIVKPDVVDIPASSVVLAEVELPVEIASGVTGLVVEGDDPAISESAGLGSPKGATEDTSVGNFTFVERPTAVVPPGAYPTDEDRLARALNQLESMGFLDREFNTFILEQNDSFASALDDLVTAGEWEPLVADLQDLGFNDEGLNRRLLFAAKGNMKVVVKQLVKQYQDDAKKAGE
eukprot:TRINITY_DN10486_c0_g1_i1.p1 TRINITY_DN10486_c0_g1~~TRINITY_DN10486_c0_g1_i1.p1  ORF type:complete len:875 (+),score=157.00 TRINITY_DN10486_c0_g1_i1:189-2813(+)